MLIKGTYDVLLRDKACQHVALGCSETAWESGRHPLWGTTERPMRVAHILRRWLGPCLDEALVIERETAVQPRRARVCARHDKDVTDPLRLVCAGLVVAPAQTLDVIVAV